MKAQKLFMALAVLILASCQSGVMLTLGDSWTSRVAEVRLLKPLTVSPDSTRVFVQDGRVIARSGYADSYRPLCAFEVRDRMESEQTISAGSFMVVRVQGLMNEVVLREPVQVAAVSLAGMDGGGAPMVHAGYHFWLASNQSDVRRMTCYGVLEVMPQVESPTLEEMRRTLAGVAELTTRSQ